jgi:hypothetical protein
MMFRKRKLLTRSTPSAGARAARAEARGASVVAAGLGRDSYAYLSAAPASSFWSTKSGRYITLSICHPLMSMFAGGGTGSERRRVKGWGG